MNSTFKTSPLALRRIPPSPTVQPAASSKAEAARRFLRSIALSTVDTAPITASSVRIVAGNSPSSINGCKIAVSSGLAGPLAAIAVFSQIELMRS